jgi:hypothetical protein
MGKKPLKFVQTSGGAFILLPLELRKDWGGAGDDPDDPKTDYARTRPFAGKLGVVKVGRDGSGLILGRPDETAFMPLEGGGVFIQRAEGEEEEELQAALDDALKATDWTPSDVSFEVGDKGRLALMDSYDTYADTEKEDRIEVQLQPGKYTIEELDVKDEDADLDLHLVRVKKA